ncbi:MAG: prepilin-type N-terminal cleavage/methylation domain-containing protein [Desulfobacterales bacterium]|nr:prepilin-type N-terminal cleavage/methylation domain-containing protein [Desulfobacterales bacterium]
MRINKNKKINGFTLIEIMIAMFIFGIIITTIFSSYNAIMTRSQALDEGMEVFEMAKNCITRITQDLELLYSAQPPLYTRPQLYGPKDVYQFVGTVSYLNATNFPKLRFTSLAHVNFENEENTGICEIVYYVQQEEDGSIILKRADNIYPYPEFIEKTSDPTLCIRVKSFSLTYYDQNNKDFDVWDSESDDFQFSIPKRIRVNLEIGDETNFKVFETSVMIACARGPVTSGK